MTLTLEKIQECAEDNYLVLSNKKYSSEDVDLVCDFLKNHPETTILFMNNAGISPGDAKKLADITSLRALKLRNNNLGGSLTHLLEGNTWLNFLDVGYNGLTDDDMEAFATNQNINTLVIDHNYIGDKGARLLAKNTGINDLNLLNNEIGNEGAEALAANSRLLRLDLGYNKVTNEGGAKFIGHTNLVSLKISPLGDMNQLSDEITKALSSTTKRNELYSTPLRATGTNLYMAYNDPNSFFNQKQIPKDVRDTITQTVIASYGF